MFHTHGHETFADRYMSAQTGPLSQWLRNRAMRVVSAVFALQILSYEVFNDVHMYNIDI